VVAEEGAVGAGEGEAGVGGGATVLPGMFQPLGTRGAAGVTAGDAAEAAAAVEAATEAGGRDACLNAAGAGEGAAAVLV
jgi:hypothetical protein